MRRRPLLLSLSLALLAFCLVVAPALAGAAPRIAGVPTAPLDEWDLTAPGDGSAATAQNLDTPGGLQPLGGESVWQEHSLDWAVYDNADIDWYKFYVTPADIAAKTCFRIEAKVETNQVDPCIEVYGPIVHTAVPGFTATNPKDMSSGPLFYWTLDSAGANPVCKAGSNDFIEGRDCRTASVVFTPALQGLESGDYYIRVRPRYFWTFSPIPIPHFEGTGYSAMAGPYVFTMQRGGFERLAGADRAETAFDIAMRSYNVYGPRGATTPDANTDGNVVIANGWKFPDALAGSALCGALQAPLLLVQQDAIPYRTQDGLDMLGATHAYVLGDPNSVSNDLMTDITHTTGNTIRFFGTNRCETAVDIAHKIKEHMPGKKLSGVAFLVNGNKWPDALAVAPYAAYAGGDGTTVTPILLTSGTSLTPVTASAITSLGITDVVVVGGPDTISDGVMNEVAQRLAIGPHVMRIGGLNRYETAMLVALWTQDKWGPGVHGDGRIGTSSSPTKLPAMSSRLEDGGPAFVVATGEKFPDALAGGAMCGRLGIPLLLTPASRMSPYILDPAVDAEPFNDYVRLSGGAALRHGWLLGGTGTLSSGVEDALNTKVSGQDWTP